MQRQPVKRLDIFLEIEARGLVERAKNLGVALRCFSESGIICSRCGNALGWDALENLSRPQYAGNYQLHCNNCMNYFKSKSMQRKALRIQRKNMMFPPARGDGSSSSNAPATPPIFLYPVVPAYHVFTPFTFPSTYLWMPK